MMFPLHWNFAQYVHIAVQTQLTHTHDLKFMLYYKLSGHALSSSSDEVGEQLLLTHTCKCMYRLLIVFEYVHVVNAQSVGCCDNIIILA